MSRQFHEEPNTHDFQVAKIEPSDDSTLDGLAVTLTDARGGRVRLHMSRDMAEIMRERISTVLDRQQGP